MSPLQKKIIDLGVDALGMEDLFYYLISGPQFREDCKRSVISKYNWLEGYDKAIDLDSKFGHTTFGKANPIFQEVETFLKQKEDVVVIQVGSCSGKDIAYFASKFPRLQFIGTDIFEEAVAYGEKHHHHDNLSFTLCSAESIGSVLKDYESREVLVFSFGSLAYVQPEGLHIFFNQISNHPNLQLMIQEAVNESPIFPFILFGSLWRGNFAYTHNYKYYANIAGLKTMPQTRLIRCWLPYEDFPEHRDCAHYFYSGRTNAVGFKE